MILVNPAVRENQNIRSFLISAIHINEDMINCAFQRRILIIQKGDYLHPEAFHLHILYLKEIRIRQNRIVNL